MQMLSLSGFNLRSTSVGTDVKRQLASSSFGRGKLLHKKITYQIWLGQGDFDTRFFLTWLYMRGMLQMQ